AISLWISAPVWRKIRSRDRSQRKGQKQAKAATKGFAVNMDPVKKLVADRLRVQVAGPHPDAEVLSAFAENALPVIERETVLQHLSTCSDCRDILFLAAPSATESQPVVSAPRARPLFALRWGTL